MDVFLSALVVILMIGGALAFLIGIIMTVTKDGRRSGAIIGLIGLVVFVAATTLGQYTV